MKYTIHTIKNKVLERFPNLSEEHYYEILEVYFSFMKEHIEKLEHIHIDNPLGTFVLRYKAIKGEALTPLPDYDEQTPRQKSITRQRVPVHLGLTKDAFQDLTDDELKIKIKEERDKLKRLLYQIEKFNKSNKITRTKESKNGRKSKNNTK